MLKKALITTLALGITVGTTAVISGAEGPIYTEDGELVLDTPQSPYQDLSDPVANVDAKAGAGADANVDGKVDADADAKAKANASASGQAGVQAGADGKANAGVDLNPDGKVDANIGVGADKGVNIGVGKDGVKVDADLCLDATTPILDATVGANVQINSDKQKECETSITTKKDNTKAQTATATTTNPTQKDFEEFGKLTPAEGTYIIGSGVPLSTEATKQIKSIKVIDGDKAVTDAWVISGNKLTSISNKMDKLTPGGYTIEVNFGKDDTANYELRVVEETVTSSYWQQNITTFNKDTRSNNHQDLMLTSSEPNVKVLELTYNDIVIPKTAYQVVKGNVIISKDYISKQPESEYDSIIVTDGNKKQTHFNLEVVDVKEKSRTTQMVNC